MIGRSRNCGLRLDASDVSSEHARIGSENGQLWVEDLGSTNGTFIGEERVSGRRFFQQTESVRVGSEFELSVVQNEAELEELGVGYEETEEVALEEFPCIFAFGEEVQPERISLRSGIRMSVGRDPANDIWINAPHISRTHLEFTWDGENTVWVLDTSSNGTIFNGRRLDSNVPHAFTAETGGPLMLDLSAGFKLEICFGQSEQERRIGSRVIDAEEVSGGEFNSNESAPYAVGTDKSSGSAMAASGASTMSNTGTFSDTMRFLAEQEVISADEFFSEARHQEPFWESSEANAGLAMDLGNSPSESQVEGSSSIFSETGGEMRNLAMDAGQNASQFQEQSFDAVLPVEPETGLDEFSSLNLGEEHGAASEFELYQRSQRGDDAGMLDSEKDYSLLEEEFGEELLDSPEFRGYSRSFLMLLVFGLILLLLVICLLVFKG